MNDVADVLDLDRLKSIIESMLLVSSEPLPLDRVREILLAEAPSTDATLIDQAAAALITDYQGTVRGIKVDEVADGLQLRTPAQNAPFLRRLLAARPPKLTKPAMETLAVIAYRQPVTKPEIESIRGVDVGAVLKPLLERDLIRIIGKSDDLGRPILYGTTKKFLELFGLKSLASLPTLREYNELDEMHQQQVDELYESDQPKISDLAAKVAFLTQRGPEGEIEALAEAEASVERATKMASTVLEGDPEAPSVEARTTEPAGPPSAPADAPTPSTTAYSDAHESSRVTDPAPPADSVAPIEAPPAPQKKRKAKAK